MGEARFQVHAMAAGEVRDAEGNLISRPTGEDTFDIDASELAVFSDEQLASAGLSQEQIKHIREGDQS